MKFRILVICALILVFVGGIYFAYTRSFLDEPNNRSEVQTPLPETSRDKVIAYLMENISVLSPEPEVLGGKFYVTKTEFLSATRARVEYEDGHNAFVAEVDFFLDPPDLVKILNFKVIQRN